MTISNFIDEFKKINDERVLVLGKYEQEAVELNEQIKKKYNFCYEMYSSFITQFFPTARKDTGKKFGNYSDEAYKSKVVICKNGIGLVDRWNTNANYFDGYNHIEEIIKQFGIDFILDFISKDKNKETFKEWFNNYYSPIDFYESRNNEDIILITDEQMKELMKIYDKRLSSKQTLVINSYGFRDLRVHNKEGYYIDIELKPESIESVPFWIILKGEICEYLKERNEKMRKYLKEITEKNDKLMELFKDEILIKKLKEVNNGTN